MNSYRIRQVARQRSESSFALRALKAGAPECLLKAIRTVLNGDYAVSTDVSKMFLNPPSATGPAELELWIVLPTVNWKCSSSWAAGLAPGKSRAN